MAGQAENKLQALPLDLQHCERVNPQTGLVECLTALVILHTLVSFCENFSWLLCKFFGDRRCVACMYWVRMWL